ncbi:unnamed protein product [Prorocentrum cordatum]|uniref:Uncharacterized protein n=1 Tax=Prorocentrum cordatum TaxID=2364126 RepID=A0ABN9VDN4_9DINO|nr:unnamed protein product [Polarella glacialis]
MSGDGTGAPPTWRRRVYWVCLCKEWNWRDKRATCKSCGKEAPAWAKRLRAVHLPQADGEGFVHQPRGRSHQRAARRAGDASRTASAASTVPSSAPNSRGRPRGGAKPPPWREEREELPEEPASSLGRRFEEAQARISSLREAVAMEGASEAFQREARAALLAAEASAERAEAELREKVEKQITATRAKREQAVQRADSLRGKIAAMQEELAEAESAVEDFDSQLGRLEESKAQTVQQALQRAIEVCGGQRPLETAVGGLVTQVSQLGEMLGRNSDGVAPGLLEIMDIITTQSAAISDMLHPAAPAAAASRWADGLGGDGLAVDDEEGLPAPAAGASAPAVQRPPAEAAGQQARVGGAVPACERAAGQLRAGVGVLDIYGNAWDRAMEAAPAHSGGVVVLAREDLQAREAQWRVPGDFKHRMVAEDQIHKAGPTSGVIRGRTVTGVADGELRGGRVTACLCAGRLPRGAAFGLGLRRAELRRGLDLDPLVLITDRTPHILAGWLRSGELPLPILRGALEAAASRQASAAVPWVHRNFPVDAVVLALGRIGWYFRSVRCLITDVGDVLDLTLMGLRELGLEASLGARRASDRHEMRKLACASSLYGSFVWGAFKELIGPGRKLSERERNGMVSHLTNAHWHRRFDFPMLAAQRRGSVSPVLMWSAVRARALGEAAGEDVARSWLSAPPPPQGPRTDAMSVWWTCRPPGVKHNGKLYVDGSSVDPQFCALGHASWAIAQCDDDGSLIAGVYGTVRRVLRPQQAARGGEDFAVWKMVHYAGPAVEEVRIDCYGTAGCPRWGLAYAACPTKANAHLWSRSLAAPEPGGSRVNKVAARGSRQAVLDGRLTEAQRRSTPHACRSAKLGARLHAEGAHTVGERCALAGFAQEQARWVGQAAVCMQHFAEKDSCSFLESDERRQVRFANQEERAALPTPCRPTAQQPRVESVRSVACAGGLSITTAGIRCRCHSLTHACCGAGGESQELVARGKCGAYMGYTQVVNHAEVFSSAGRKAFQARLGLEGEEAPQQQVAAQRQQRRVVQAAEGIGTAGSVPRAAMLAEYGLDVLDLAERVLPAYAAA